jgi:hypothetical protein
VGSNIDSIANFQLLDPGTNRGGKNAKPFAAWINNPKYVKDKSAFTKLHLIPTDETLWVEHKFEYFLEERAKLIVTKIDNYTA